jgi:hypothetical protein
MKLTNNLNVPLSMAVWLGFDEYKQSTDPRYISATGLLKPLRAIILGRRIPPENQVEDVSDRLASAFGHAVHNHINKAWLKDPHLIMRRLGIPASVVSRVVVNPKPEHIRQMPNLIPVYTEHWMGRKFEGWRIGGTADFIGDGVLEDTKTTSTYKYVKGDTDDFMKQGSIYRWLDPKLITKDFIRINYYFTDWSKLRYLQEGKSGYPSSKMVSQEIKLMSLDETADFIRRRITAIAKLENAPQEQLPQCTDNELWRAKTVFKYYKNPDKAYLLGTRSTKNFDFHHEAEERFIQDGKVGAIVPVKGQVKRCLYCAAYDLCQQKNQFILDGVLEAKD